VAGEASLEQFLVGETVRGRATEAATDALREAILTGYLKPGAWLREDEVATELRVSRTPVREAFRRLADEGLLVKTTHQGTVVAPISLEDILALYAVREHLEGASAKFAAQHRTPQLVAELEAVHRKMGEAADDPPTMAAYNRAFHRIIYAAAQNPFLDRFMRQIEHAVRRLPTTTFLAPGRPDSVLEEHQAIIEGIAAGDQDLAMEAAMAHMRAARNVRVKMALHGS
jgi:DNA-binding GntR family transcriptional regulator